jgi:chorismate dehydratase
MIRLGRISYLNMAPVFFGLEADVEEVTGVPTELNRALLDGDVDVAPISSIAWARHADRLVVLPGLCVSSDGAAGSIQLVSQLPLERIRSIAVTPESATSAVLLRVLVPDADHVALDDPADATLLIGDAALRSAFEDPTPHHDLGRLWARRAGLPMVFAVWACADPPPTDVAELEEALLASVRLAREHSEQVARDAADRYGYPPGFVARYFERLRYDFGPREREGLEAFLELAKDVGELESVPKLRFAGEAVAA